MSTLTKFQIKSKILFPTQKVQNRNSISPNNCNSEEETKKKETKKEETKKEETKKEETKKEQVGGKTCSDSQKKKNVCSKQMCVRNKQNIFGCLIVLMFIYFFKISKKLMKSLELHNKMLYELHLNSFKRNLPSSY